MNLNGLNELQIELAKWQAKNFKEEDSKIELLALGMAEEVGETCHHILKGIQRIRGGTGGINESEIIDGVCDTMIYGIQILTKLNAPAGVFLKATALQVMARNWKDMPEGNNKPIQEDK